MKFELEIVKFAVNDVVTASTTDGGLGKLCDYPDIIPEIAG